MSETATDFNEMSMEEQAAAFMSGDFGTAPAVETVVKPDAEIAVVDAGAGEPPEDVVADKVVEPVVQARNGRDVIPYSELEKARADALRYEQASRAQAVLISELQAAKEKDAETGGTKEQEKVMAEYAGDFPELVADIKPYLASMIDSAVAERVKALEADRERAIEEKIKPLKVAEAQRGVDAHFSALGAKHPDYAEIAADPKFGEWIQSQPSFVRAQYDAVAKQGTTTEVIELLDTYKKSLPQQAVKQSPDDIAKKAAEILAGTKRKPPVSLSDVPGSSVAAHSEREAFLNMSPDEKTIFFMDKTPAQIDAFLNKYA